MDIVMIGTGNVAAVLGRKFRAAGHRIVQVVGRNSTAASALAYEWNTVSTNYQSPIAKNADVYIVAVSDNAVATVMDNVHLPEKVVAHTAASLPMDVFKGVTSHYGVFYPLQTLRKEMKELPDVPIFIDGHDDITKSTLSKLARSISFESVREADDEGRKKLHVAAVFVSNFVNHLYALAEGYCKTEGLDFRQLWPLIIETAMRVEEISPGPSQTGPAIRHDRDTIEKHLALLQDHPRLKNIYILLTESIQHLG